jgi:hypothetical protein
MEHLLEYDFGTYFPLVRTAIGAEPLLAETLRSCWPFGEAERHWWKVRRLLARTRRTGSGRGPHQLSGGPRAREGRGREGMPQDWDGTALGKRDVP